MLKKDKKFKAVIIGAGRIACGFDDPKSKNILTHAHAYLAHPRTRLAGIYDLNPKISRKEAEKWGSRAFADLDNMFREAKPDIISVCTPDSEHYPVLLKVAEYKPKMVICEKPITTDIKKTLEIMKIYAGYKISMLINFPRRFNPTIQNEKKNIASGNYGKVLAAYAIYTKGTNHSGSHAIDLARFLFGEVKNVKLLFETEDYDRSDKTTGAFLTLKNCRQFYMIPADERRYSIFEFDILCEKKRLRFNDFGFFLEKQAVKKDSLYGGYRILDKPSSKRTQANSSLYNMVDNAVGHLESRVPLLCDISDALKTQKVCNLLLSKKHV
jgi:predicted dehydrogenase